MTSPDETNDDSDLLSRRLERLYELYRSSLLNEKIYGHRLARQRQIFFWMSVFTVICSVIAGTASKEFWGRHEAESVPLLAALVATALAGIRAVADFTSTEKRYTKLFYGHKDNSLRLADIVEKTKTYRSFADPFEDEAEVIRQKYIELARQDDPDPPKYLMRRFQKEINTQVPPDTLWTPHASR